MLRALAIKNFAIIDDIQIDFSRGLSVLTGETGAGKSIIIQAVNLLLGQRASTDLVRTGQEYAELEACFDIEPGGVTAGLLEAQGIDSSEGLMIRRVISNSARSRIFINSRQSTVQLLREMTRNLAGISSQHAHQELLNEDFHLDILDRFAGTSDLKKTVSGLYHELIPLKKERDQLVSQADRHREEADFLDYQISEIEAAGIRPDEDLELEERRRQLSNATGIFNALANAVDDLHEKEGSVLDVFNLTTNAIDRFSSDDPELVPFVARLRSLMFDVEDLAMEIRSHSGRIDMDPQSLEQVEQRLDLIQKLKRKYGPGLDDLFRTCDTLRSRLDRIGHSDKRITELEQLIGSRTTDLAQQALVLSQKRKQAAGILSDLVQRQLSDLEMADARFEISIEAETARADGSGAVVDGKMVTAAGMDRVCFLLSPNPGEDPKPLAKIASGGELSRIVLALKAVLSGIEAQQTLIFDEVDAGIGGATAEKLGVKLHDLSRAHQVIVITHLAQIAKYADHQYRIIKTVDNGHTRTRILLLTSEDQRVEEIARMIAGKSISTAARSHARDLLADGKHLTHPER